MTPLAVAILALGGGVLGFAADRLAARWPVHADGRVRSIDWRTVAVAASGALAFAGLAARWSDPRDVAVLAVAFAALVILLGTDLDQKLLPDLLTLPLIAYAAVMVVVGWDPLLATKSLSLLSAVLAGVGAPIVLLISSRLFGGALGMGDVKLAVSLGLLAGVTLLVSGFLVASIAAAVLLLALIAIRRIGLRSAIPFGPILIAAGIIAGLLPT